MPSRPVVHVVHVVLVVLTAALCACPGRLPTTTTDAGAPDEDDGGVPPADAGPLVYAWSEAFDTSLGAGTVSSMWGSAPDDLFAVGGGDDGGTVTHFDGDAWTTTTLPGVGFLIWAKGFAPDDVIAVGLGGSAAHFDGATWTPLDTGTTTDLWGVFGFTNDDVWIVGGATDVGDPLTLHWDGDLFTEETVPADQNPAGAHALFKIFGVDGRLFAVGQRGLIVERVANAWVFHDAGENADDDFISLWGTSENRIVAVGGRANARIATFDGTTWTTIAPEGVGGLNAVFMTEPRTAIVAGIEGTAALLDVDTGALTFEETDTRFDLHALWGDGAGKHYAVGGSFLSPYRGVALVRAAQ